LVPVRKKEDLEDIMSALEELTGEKYEISIDLGKEDEEFSKEILEEKKEKKLEYTEKDIKKYQKETGKNAIWRGKLTKGYKEWLNKKKKS
jgi:ribulose 1,5-bisphosphate carboxylase large subunit-like protein